MLVPVLNVMHRGVVLREERYLEQKFAEPYREYRANVRRYLQARDAVLDLTRGSIAASGGIASERKRALCAGRPTT